MCKTRQFLRSEDLETVLCQWNEVTGSWRCRSRLHNSTHHQLYPFVRKLIGDGFEEISPLR